MKHLKIFDSACSLISKTGFQINKFSPEILVILGIAGTVTSAVLACRATLKVDSVVSPAKDKIARIHDCKNNPDFSDYSEKDETKDLTIVYIQTGLKIVKEYAPAVILGALSLTAIMTSHNILKKRNLVLAGAYAALDKGFKEYRARVSEKFGEEVERKIRHNIKDKQIIESTVNPETGEVSETKKTVETKEIDLDSPFVKFFDETTSKYWEKDPVSNLAFLRCQQDYFNNRLHANGYVFFNEVLQSLGMPITETGQIFGWLDVPRTAEWPSDNYITFGIEEIYRDYLENGKTSLKRGFLLSFNVEGYILDKLKIER